MIHDIGTSYYMLGFEHGVTEQKKSKIYQHYSSYRLGYTYGTYFKENEEMLALLEQREPRKLTNSKFLPVTEIKHDIKKYDIKDI